MQTEGGLAILGRFRSDRKQAALRESQAAIGNSDAIF
jgi:hypothetical protein